MAGRSVCRPLPGSAELPRAARRALGRHRSRAGALPSGHFDHAGTPLLRLVPPLRVPSSCCGSILRLIIVHSCQGRSIDQYTAQLSGGSAGGVRSSSMQQSAGRARRVCACAWWHARGVSLPASTGRCPLLPSAHRRTSTHLRSAVSSRWCPYLQHRWAARQEQLHRPLMRVSAPYSKPMHQSNPLQRAFASSTEYCARGVVSLSHPA